MSKITHAGFDLGKDSAMLSFPSPAQQPRDWPVETIDYKQPNWPNQLLDRLAPNAICVAEPTGGNLIAPLATVLRPIARLYLVNHASTGRIRAEHVSRTKSDPTDARALALIATWIDTPSQPRSARPYLHADEEATAALRLYLDLHRRLTKQHTATRNRLHALGFGMWPQLSYSLDTWLKAIHQYDTITPADLHQIAAHPPTNVDMRGFRHIEALAAKLPDIDVHPARRTAVQYLATDLQQLEQELAATNTVITDLIEQPPFDQVTAIWRTVPGSGTISIAALHAAVHGQINSFTVDEFRSAIGTNPQGRSSGKSSRSKQSRSGYKPAAAQIHLWTMLLVNLGNNPISDYYQRTSSPRALAAARNKLARILWTLAVRKEPCSW